MKGRYRLILLVRNLEVNGRARCDPVIRIRRSGMINHQVEKLIAVPRPLVQPCSAQNTQCVNCARWDLCGGHPVTGVPTAIRWAKIIDVKQVDVDQPSVCLFFGVALKLAGRWLYVCRRSWGCPKWGDGPHVVHIDCSTCKIAPQAARYCVIPLVRSFTFVSASANDV